MKNKTEIIEDIQEAIIEAGGRFMRSHEIYHMTLAEFIDIATRNNISVSVKYMPTNE